MPLQTIQVEVPEGYEAIGYRNLKIGDTFLEAGGEVNIAAINFSAPRIILRKSFVWPEWLNAKAIAMDSNGSWWAYNCIPWVWENATVWGKPDTGGTMFDLRTPYLKLDLPKFGNWKDSLIINPNYKES